MKQQLTPIERHKRDLSITTWVLSFLTIIIISTIIVFISNDCHHDCH